MTANNLPTVNVKELEKMALIQALDQTSWQARPAAKAMGISRTTVFTLIKKYGIQKKVSTVDSQKKEGIDVYFSVTKHKT